MGNEGQPPLVMNLIDDLLNPHRIPIDEFLDVDRQEILILVTGVVPADCGPANDQQVVKPPFDPLREDSPIIMVRCDDEVQDSLPCCTNQLLGETRTVVGDQGMGMNNPFEINDAGQRSGPVSLFSKRVEARLHYPVGAPNGKSGQESETDQSGRTKREPPQPLSAGDPYSTRQLTTSRSDRGWNPANC